MCLTEVAPPTVAAPASTLLDAALEYAANGYAVFPCKPGEKVPACAHGVKDATTNPELIQCWWMEEPAANIGLAADGLLVLDFDPGATWLDGDARAAETLAAAAVQQTPRGGVHRIFKKPAGRTWQNTVSKLAAHVDTRTDGGYIVVAPSSVAGAPYEWLRPLPPKAELPEPPLWLQQRMDKLRTPAPVPAAPPPAGNGNGQFSHWAAAVLRDFTPGKRNALAFKIACEGRARAIPQAEVEAILLPCAGADFTEAEIRRTIQSGYSQERAASPPDMKKRDRAAHPTPQKNEATNTQAGYPETPAESSAKPQDSEAPADNWPAPLGDAALHGLAGDIVRTVEPHTEADPAALLIHLLVAFGNQAGRAAYWRVCGDRHYGNEYAVVVGSTSRGRKGTAGAAIMQFFRPVAGDSDQWGTTQIVDGLSTGEGLIHRLRDGTAGEAGATDKRLMVVEPEFARVLRQAEREGNSLSAIVRTAWDRGDLQVLTRHDPLKATGCHLSIVAHVTKAELAATLADTEVSNGFGNRFLWVAVRRSKMLPDGGNLDTGALAQLRGRLVEAVRYAQGVELVTRDTAAARLWREVYPRLAGDTDEDGLAANMLSRAEAHVMRLALIYALLDQADTIKEVHLRAALEVWRYCEASARCIFGECSGNSLADNILAALSENPTGLNRTQLRNYFHRNVKALAMSHALDTLAKAGKVRCVIQPTGHRPEERYFAISA